MTIQYASDLHFEFSETSKFLAEHPMQPVGEVLVLAGDIDCLDEGGYPDRPFWDWASDNFEMVLVVPGNHEYYGGFDISRQEKEKCVPIRKNVFLCNNHVITVDGVEFVLTTLWSSIRPFSSNSIERFVSDYRRITYDGQRFTAKIANECHHRSIGFLKAAFEKPKIGKRVVVTHHVPSLTMMADEFVGSILNDAFVSDLDELIYDSNADVWIFGHSHRNLKSTRIGSTLLCTNQLGYVGLGEHGSFSSLCTFKL